MSENFIMKSEIKNGIKNYIFQNVDSIKIKQSIINKVLNIGDVVVYSKSGIQTKFNSIKSPQNFIKQNILIV